MSKAHLMLGKNGQLKQCEFQLLHTKHSQPSCTAEMSSKSVRFPSAYPHIHSARTIGKRFEEDLENKRKRTCCWTGHVEDTMCGDVGRMCRRGKEQLAIVWNETERRATDQSDQRPSVQKVKEGCYGRSELRNPTSFDDH